jgi:hypothetical protein
MLLRAHHEEGAPHAADERPNLSALAVEKLAALDELAITVHHRLSPVEKAFEADDEQRLTVMKTKKDAPVQPTDPTDRARRSAALLALGTELDANYRIHEGGVGRLAFRGTGPTL